MRASASRPRQPVWWGLATARAAVVGVALLLAVTQWGPNVFPLGSLPAVGGHVDPDCFQGVWNLWFAAETIGHGHNPFHAEAIYYPLGANLAHHTLTLGFFPYTRLVQLLSNGDRLAPLYAYELLPLVGFTLLLVCTWGFLRGLDFGLLASAVGAIGYAFGRLYVHHSIHPNYLAGFFLPLCAWQLVRLYRAPSPRRAVWVGFWVAISVYFTELTAYAYLAIVAAALLIALRQDGRVRLRMTVRTIGPLGIAAALAVWTALVGPYLVALHRDSIVLPPASESVQYASNLLGFFVPDRDATPLYDSLFEPIAHRMIAGVGGRDIFIGFATLILAGVGIFTSRRHLVRGAALLAGVFYVLSLGPSLDVLDRSTTIPMPYAWLGHMPIFESGRTPVRLVAIGGLFLAVVVASGLEWLRGASLWRARWVAGMALLWVVAEAWVPRQEQARFTIPSALQQLAPGPVLDLPPLEKDGYAAMLQTLHGLPIATGYTARISMPALQHVRELRRAFDKGGPDFWSLAARLNIRNIIVSPRSVTAPYAPSMTPLGTPPPEFSWIDLRDPGVAPEVDCDAENGTPAVATAGRLDFTTASANLGLCYGWGPVEDRGRWTVRGQASLRIATPNAGSATAGRFRFRALPFIVSGKGRSQRVGIEINGVQVAQLELTSPVVTESQCSIPYGVLRPVNEVVFVLPDANSPLALRVAPDRRTVAIHVEWVELEALY